MIQWRSLGPCSLTTTTTMCLPWRTDSNQRENSRELAYHVLRRTWSGAAKVSARRWRCSGSKSGCLSAMCRSRSAVNSTSACKYGQGKRVISFLLYLPPRVLSRACGPDFGAVAKSVSARLPIFLAGELCPVPGAFWPFSGVGGTGQEIGSLCQGALQQPWPRFREHRICLSRESAAGPVSGFFTGEGNCNSVTAWHSG